MFIDPRSSVKACIEKFEDYYDYVINERTSDGTTFSDIHDGDFMKTFKNNLSKNYQKSYATATVGLDGFDPFEESNKSAWPIYICLHQIPLSQRFKNLITVGLWFGKSQPNMTVYVNEFVKLMNQITDEGIECNVKGRIINVRLFIINSAVDTPARVRMNGTVSYTGYFGCDYCYIRGIYKEKAMRFPCIKKTNPRTHKSTIQDMLKAEEIGKSFRGLKNVSPLIFLNSFDIISSQSPDYMHCGLLGVAKKILKRLVGLCSPHQRLKLDEYIMKIKLPSHFNRCTMPLNNISIWKAKDFEIFVLYVSIPLFEMVDMNSTFIEYWNLFANSLHVFLSKVITRDQIYKCYEDLKKFQTLTDEYFQIRELTYNLHIRVEHVW